MEHLGTMHTLAQNLYSVLQSSELKELCSVWAYESELENLQRTVNTIKAVLLVAESKAEQAELSHQDQLWMEELNDALYDADDLIDEFNTLAKQKQLRAKDEIVLIKVCRFFSSDNPLLVAFNMYQGGKVIKNKLDAIANNHNRFGFKLDRKPIHRRRVETCSYINGQDIIGREDDKETIVSKLLDPNVQRDVSCLAIVGIGGLGKTALAQLVYNDPRIETKFPLRLWTRFSDQDKQSLDIKSILCKILQSATNVNHKDLEMEPLHKELQQQLAGNKFFIVLDDVWNENRLQWKELAKFLMNGRKGSWIVVTTRSQNTAMIIEEHTHELKGLSKEDSWHLFKMTAFEQRIVQAYPTEKVEIGREIVKKCANVPLAIRVIGNLLYGQDKDKWKLFQQKGLSSLQEGENRGIEPILKINYHQLDSPLKICFSFCALFPKDYKLKRRS